METKRPTVPEAEEGPNRHRPGLDHGSVTLVFCGLAALSTIWPLVSAAPPARAASGWSPASPVSVPARAPDTVRVPRADTVPEPDCDLAEWPARGRIELRPGVPGAFSRGLVEGGDDLSARIELVWSEGALHLLADVRDDWVLGGTEGGGDWLQLRLGGTSVWLGAPGPTGSTIVVGARATGAPVRRSAGCRRDYGWTAEAEIRAGLLPEPPQLGAVVGFRVLAEDEDAGAGSRSAVLWREGHLFFTAGESATPSPASDSLLRELREPTTLEELSRRPGARDTAIVVGGREYPAVRLPVGDAAVTAFASSRDTSAVTYWLGPESEEALERLGLRRSMAALRRELGALQRGVGDVPYAWPRVRFELLPGVIFRLGFPESVTGQIPASTVPEGVFIETRRPGGGDGTR